MSKSIPKSRYSHTFVCISLSGKMAPDAWLFFLLFQDPRFNSEVDKATGYKTHSILCMPIKSHDGEVPIICYFFLVNLATQLVKNKCICSFPGYWSSSDNQQEIWTTPVHTKRRRGAVTFLPFFFFSVCLIFSIYLEPSLLQRNGQRNFNMAASSSRTFSFIVVITERICLAYYCKLFSHDAGDILWKIQFLSCLDDSAFGDKFYRMRFIALAGLYEHGVRLV